VHAKLHLFRRFTVIKTNDADTMMMLQVSYCRRDALPSRTGHFQWQQLEPGTVHHLRREPPTHCCSYGDRQKRISFASRFWIRTLVNSMPYKGKTP